MNGRHSVIRKYRLSFFLILLSFSITQSCSVGDYLGAYFNTYFNASRLFEEAEAEIQEQRIARQNDTTFLPDYRLQAATKTKLTSVVEKCSKILDQHPESGLADDALMMIGKSFYYQNELQKAQRKFAELIQNRPESSLRPEAELLLANTSYRMKDMDAAVDVATALADSTGGDEEAITARAFLLLGQIQYENGDYMAANRSYGYAAEYAGSSGERVSAYMRKALMSRQIGDPEAALEAYRLAEDAASDYESEYHARMGQARMLVLMNRHVEAMDVLEDLRSNTNFREFFADIDLEHANALRTHDEIEEAMELYYLIDTVYSRTNASAEAHYQLGQLYELRFNDLDSALALYKRGRGESAQSEYAQVMNRRVAYLTSYQQLRSEISEMESLKTVIIRGEPTTDQLISVADDSTTVSDTLARAPAAPLPDIDSLQSSLARSKADIAGLFYSSISQPDSARYWYENLLHDHPQSAYSARALYTLAQIHDQEGNKNLRDSLYEAVLSEYPETVFADEARRFLGHPPRVEKQNGAAALYARGESFLNADSTANAIVTFRQVRRDYPDSPIAPKAQYAIGWIYEQDPNGADSAVAYYRQLVADFPSTEYAMLAAIKLKEVPLAPVVVDTADSMSTLQEDQIPDTTGIPEDSLLIMLPVGEELADSSGMSDDPEFEPEDE